MPASASRVTAEEVARYVDLSALELVMTSDYALGGAFSECLSTLDLNDEGLDLIPGSSGGPGLQDLFSHVFAAGMERTVEGYLLEARGELLTARLLRAITPEVVHEAATYFERLAEEHLCKAMAGGGSEDA